MPGNEAAAFALSRNLERNLELLYVSGIKFSPGLMEPIIRLEDAQCSRLFFLRAGYSSFSLPVYMCLSLHYLCPFFELPPPQGVNCN